MAHLEAFFWRTFLPRSSNSGDRRPNLRLPMKTLEYLKTRIDSCILMHGGQETSSQKDFVAVPSDGGLSSISAVPPDMYSRKSGKVSCPVDVMCSDSKYQRQQYTLY